MELLLNMLVNIVCIFTGIWVINKIMKKRDDKIGIRIVLSVFLSLFQTFISFLNIPWLNMISMLLVLIIATVIIFRPVKYYFLLYDILIIVSMFSADIISTLCLSVMFKNTIISTLQQTNMIIARYILTCIITFIFCNIAFAFVKKKKTDFLWHEVIVYIMLIIFEVATSAYMINNIQHNSTGVFIILFLCGCLVLDIYIVLVFDSISKSRKTEKENALLKQQSHLQFSVYKDLQQRYERSIRIVHDAKKHVNALEGLIESDNIPKASQYKNELYSELDKLHPSFKNDNELLSVIINHALLKAEQNNIKMHMQIEEIELSFISDIDLTTIISNILDNSIEAVSELPQDKRIVWFVIEKRMGCCLIHSENYFDHVRDISFNRYASTKKGHMGIGLTNVETAVKKYNGMFSVETDRDKFITSVTIPER